MSADERMKLRQQLRAMAPPENTVVPTRVPSCPLEVEDMMHNGWSDDDEWSNGEATHAPQAPAVNTNDLGAPLLALVEQTLRRGPFVVGDDYTDVPIVHDILRAERAVYNTRIDGRLRLQGRAVEFVKVAALPTAEEVAHVEWRTVDLMNHLCYSNTSRTEQLCSLIGAIRQRKLDLALLKRSVEKYGSEDAQRLMAAVASMLDQFPLDAPDCNM